MARKAKISNGNRTERRPIQSVIMRVINKIGRPRRESPICFNNHEYDYYTDRIGRHEVLLPINHNFKNFFDIQGSFLKGFRLSASLFKLR